MEDSNPVLPPAARRALAEAAARRAEKPAEARSVAPEIGGPDGPEPTRYGDWERKGIASDF
ncbi:MAG: succinate dehydrogenase assembly factor 4 [Aestuariivirgaceae bacterium]